MQLRLICHSSVAGLCYLLLASAPGAISATLGQSPIRRGPLLLFAVGFVCAWPASAAQVTVVPDQKSSNGAVMLSRGRGYAPIAGPTTANTGDQVVAFTGGHARVIYPDGCIVEVHDGGTVFVVSETSPCKAPAALPTASGSLPVGKYVVGAAIVAGGTAALILSFGGGDDNGGKNKNGSGGHHDHGSGNPASP